MGISILNAKIRVYFLPCLFSQSRLQYSDMPRSSDRQKALKDIDKLFDLLIIYESSLPQHSEEAQWVRRDIEDLFEFKMVVKETRFFNLEIISIPKSVAYPRDLLWR